MKELIPTIKEGLGPDRLHMLEANEDEHQEFWLGVLNALSRVDWSKDVVGFLISNGYGAIRNMRRAENSRSGLRFCRGCGRTFGNRTMECPACRRETERQVRISSVSAPGRSDLEFEDGRHWGNSDLRMDVEAFASSLYGQEAYLAKRWLVERADLTCQNHLSQLAWEMGISKARVSQIKASVRDKFKRWYYGK